MEFLSGRAARPDPAWLAGASGRPGLDQPVGNKASFLLGIEAGLFVFFGTRGVNPGDDIEKDIGASVPLLFIFTLGLVCLFEAPGH